MIAALLFSISFAFVCVGFMAFAMGLSIVRNP